MLYLVLRPHLRAIFYVVHERIRYFNWFMVLTFEICAGGWRDMVFFCSKIVQESTKKSRQPSYCSLTRASFGAFPYI